MLWLLEARVRQAIEQAQKAGVVPSVTQQAEFVALHGVDGGAASRLLTVAGDTAQITISGVITQKPSWMAMIFGGGNVTFPEINAALAEAEQDKNIKKVTLAIDSPGGSFDGLFETLAAIEAFSKPTKAVISNVGASAAFALASQADEVVASNIAARIGSVGVVASFFVDDNEIDIASTNAPKKRPDVTTEEGVAMVREELDAMHEIFVDAIARGRGTTVENVNADFGQGATLLANEALKRGMIDAVAGSSPLKIVGGTESTTTASSGGDQREAEDMDLNKLRAEHPAVYAEAVQIGATGERDRVTAHMIMGEASGAMTIAAKAVKDGSPMTETLRAEYTVAGMNRNDVEARQDDDKGADAGDKANLGDEQGDAGDTVASLVEKRLGVSGGAE